MSRALRIAGAGAIALLAACNSTDATGNGGPVSPCPGGASPQEVSLAVGHVRVLGDAASLSCVSLSAPDGGAATYVVVAANADPTPDDTGRFVMADSAASLSAAVHASRLTGAGARPVGALGAAAALAALAVRDDPEGRIRAMERRVLPLGRPAGARIEASVRAATSAATLPALGDTLSFKVPDPNADNACTTFSTVKSVVKAIGRHGIIVQDTAAPSGGFTSSDFSAIVQEFDDAIYPADTVHFGSPSDIDGNDHVYLLFTPKVNAATTRGANGVLQGFFFGGDLFPPSQCAESNQGELFYLLVPDPQGKFSDARSASSVRQDTRGTIAHEFQHMINEGTRIAENVPGESVWLNEALSHFAEELVGRDEHGFGDTRELGIADVADAQNNFADFNAFFGNNIVRLRDFLADTGTIGATSVHADSSLRVRGAAWSLLRWSADHFSGGNVAAFTRALVAGPDTSVDNLLARTGAPFDTLMAGWLVANYADDGGISGLASLDTYSSWKLREVEAAVNNGVFPLQPIALGSAAPTTRIVASAAAVYFEVGVDAGGARVIGELAPDGGAVTFPGARMYVLRVR
ncbi:MAG TPA: hypothetical protein VFS44_10745 [Gemmatimonadaceae bacterium]|nr:hypothetical protein [Gemmatimonadaceae bacterium]